MTTVSTLCGSKATTSTLEEVGGHKKAPGLMMTAALHRHPPPHHKKRLILRLSALKQGVLLRHCQLGNHDLPHV